MTFTILSDSDVKSILSSLSQSDVSHVADLFIQSLVQYSCYNEAQYQPERAVIKRGDQSSVFMPATTPHHIGVKIVGISQAKPPSLNEKPKPGIQATLAICDTEGKAVGVLNAAEITAFRTALGSILLYRLRKRTANIVVFGAGAQARWHIRLALILRGADIENITIVNRSKARADELIAGLKETGVPSHVQLHVREEGESLEDLVVDADVIFCGVPSTTPLFPAKFLTGEKARAKTRYIAAIGSYRLDMQEIDPELLKSIADPAGVFKEQVWQSKVVVDSAEGCLAEAGELDRAEIRREGMLEVGKIQDLRSSESPEGLEQWLADGFVVYKSVGFGIMDIAIGSKLLELAKEKGRGVYLDDF
ncbi:NAD(P)-binding protein [Macroventuria anomochaeta]|uniref:NAD(P)-binding protein n=1 Tax=Macroventuria anomochaeta TaxID=301207 RepID=A0ACB6SI58_9PLEO|nr:NAD(P)-binding protein [Macroventuria anomochaeta]KAF2632964.1 NAD(P)-binding protein [Macroventuria anomochaeta]